MAFEVKLPETDSGTTYEVGMGVAGIPHAYRWRLGAPGAQRLLEETGRAQAGQPPSVRIALPDDGRFVPARDKLEPVRVEVYTPHDSWATRERDLTLQLFLQSPGQSPGLLEEWRGIRGTQRRVTLAVKDGLITLETEMSDFVVPAEKLADTLRTDGAWTLSARLLQRGQKIDESAITLGVDTTPPTVRWIRVQADAVFDPQRALEMQASADDPDSGIVRYTLKILKDGKEVNSRNFQPRSVSPIPVRPVIGLFPGPGTYEVQLEVENQAGLSGVNTNKKFVTIKAPEKAAAGTGK